MLFVNRLSPWAIHVVIGGHEFGVRWYGLAYALGFWLTWLALMRAAREGRAGLNRERVDTLLVRIMLGVLIGGRVGFVVQHPVELLHRPVFLFEVWNGGMAFFGGLLGVVRALWWSARVDGVQVPALLDVLTFPSSLGLAFGRVANFVNGELVGRPTHADWGVIFPAIDALPRHPSQLYESVSHFVLFAILVWLWRYRRGWAEARAGRLSWVFLALYGTFRFLTDFFRADDVFWGPFSDGQWFSLALAVIGVLGLWGSGREAGPPAQGEAGGS